MRFRLPDATFIIRDDTEIFHSDLRLEIFPTVEGSHFRVDHHRAHKPLIVRVNWVPNRPGHWRTEYPKGENEPAWSTYEAKDWANAYRAACRAIDSISNLARRAAFHRAVKPIQLAEVQVLGLWSRNGRNENYDCVRISYRWRFLETSRGTWDVEVDERYRKRFKGIACYTDNFGD